MAVGKTTGFSQTPEKVGFVRGVGKWHCATKNVCFCLCVRALLDWCAVVGMSGMGAGVCVACVFVQG